MAFSYLLSLPALLDGATGTELQKRGLPPNVCSELWALEHPEAVIGLQRDYIAAGSRIVYAPTFSANRPCLDKHGVTRSVESLCQGLVALSREAAAGSGALVAGDMAPCGLQMEPLGKSSYGDLVAVFLEQARALEKAGVDLYAVETQISLPEAKAAVEAVRQVSDKPILVSFACGPTGRSLWGDSLPEAAQELEAMGVDAFGVNCCGDLALLTELIAAIREKCSLPLAAKPNAGLPEFIDGRAHYAMSPEALAEAVPGLYKAGASLFGGCCGTTAAHIAAMGRALAAL